MAMDNKLEATKENETVGVAQQIKELKETLEKNAQLSKVIDEEPRKVVSKIYLQGDPMDLYNVCNSIFNSLKPKKQGERPGKFALTLMVEDITPKNT